MTNTQIEFDINEWCHLNQDIVINNAGNGTLGKVEIFRYPTNTSYSSAKGSATPRLELTIGTSGSGADLIVDHTDIVVGSVINFRKFKLNLPSSIEI